MRWITPTNGRDPWSVATSRWLDQTWSSFACENHVFLHDDAYWVEMYVSRLSPDVTFKAFGSNSLQARAAIERSQRGTGKRANLFVRAQTPIVLFVILTPVENVLLSLTPPERAIPKHNI